MPSAAFIEDHDYRVSILSGQPLGVGVVTEGELQVSLKRSVVPLIYSLHEVIYLNAEHSKAVA